MRPRTTLLLVGLSAFILVPSYPQGARDQSAAVPQVKFKAHKGDLTALVITPDGKVLASSSGEDGAVKLWSLPGGRLLATLEGHKGGVNRLAITPDGKILASGGVDANLKLWSLPEGRLLATLQGHSKRVQALAITPDGKTLVSSSSDDSVKLWSLPEGHLLANLQTDNAGVDAFAVTPDSTILASNSKDNKVRLWSIPAGRLLATLEGHKGAVNALAITPDGKALASGSGDKTIKLWSLPEGRLLATLEGHRGPVNALAITPGGNALASGEGGEWQSGRPSGDNTIKLWSLPEGRLLATLQGHSGSIEALTIAPDGRTLASGSDDESVKLWSLLEGRLLVTLQGHTGSPRMLIFTPDGKILVSGQRWHATNFRPGRGDTILMEGRGHHAIVILSNLARLASLSESEMSVPCLQQLEKSRGEAAKLTGADVTDLARAAEAGDTRAQRLLGEVYSYGYGVRQSFKEGEKWYRMAAEHGDTVSQYSLGNFFQYGRAVREDLDEAMRWYEKAAEQGMPEAQAKLGLLSTQKGNATEAAIWNRRAAEQGDGMAQFNLAIMYANGRGVPQDHLTAYVWFSVGYAPCETHPGMCTQQNPEKEALLRRLIAQEAGHLSAEELAEGKRGASQWRATCWQQPPQ